ncbi:MAG: methanogenesis marker protein Mmp4/MtxX [Candidatus Hodarchaeota archaeon]
MIIQKFERVAKEKKRNIGIGLGDIDYHNQKILKASLSFIEEYKSDVYLFGKTDFMNKLLKEIAGVNIKSRVKFIECQDPEVSIFEYLGNKSIHSIIRGSLSSYKFLKNVKIYCNCEKINRLALLETFNGHQFFFGPVGIDECTSLKNKTLFLESAVKELYKLNIIPIVSILSGGRIADIGRDTIVDQTIQEAMKLVEFAKEKFSNLKISHDEILIENAVEKKSNLIIAPNGISGNLIYRTLVHLGGGKAYGAIYMGLEGKIIDTSRVGNFSEIYGALVLAVALSN